MANHAHSTRTPLLRQITASAGLLAASIPSGRIVAAGGPVTRALAVMADADPDLARIRVLRRSIADRIEADIALLDVLGGDADFEPAVDDEPSGDDEPSLGSLGGTAASDHCSQLMWGDGSTSDGEPCIQDEPHDEDSDLEPDTDAEPDDEDKGAEEDEGPNGHYHLDRDMAAMAQAARSQLDRMVTRRQGHPTPPAGLRMVTIGGRNAVILPGRTVY